MGGSGFLATVRMVASMRNAILALLIVAGSFPAFADPSQLKPETAAAFDHYVRVTEARMNDDLDDGGFFAIDALPDQRRQAAYERIRRGQIYLEPLRTLEDRHSIRVPGGMVHHWAGVIFIPGVTLSETLAVLKDYNNHKSIYSPVIRDSKLLEHDGNDFKVYLQFYSTSVAVVVLNVNFDVAYAEFGNSRVQSTSHSQRIAEIENLGKPNERERPVGNDHGYLWRLESYWRVEEKDGGVYIQNESIALTRTIPVLLAWLINPLVKSIPRGVISSLLLKTRDAVLKARPASVPGPPPVDKPAPPSTEEPEHEPEH